MTWDDDVDSSLFLLSSMVMVGSIISLLPLLFHHRHSSLGTRRLSAAVAPLSKHNSPQSTKTMKAGKPFLIAGVPIAGLALHSLSSGGAGGVASAWTPPRPTAPPSSSSAASRSSHVVGRRHHHHGRPTPTSSTISSRANNKKNNKNLLLFSTSTNLDDNLLQSLHLTPELQMMTQAFASIPDEKTRHKQLLYMASKLPTVNEEETTLRIPENKVPGCLSTVHVDCVVEKKSGVEV